MKLASDVALTWRKTEMLCSDNLVIAPGILESGRNEIASMVWILILIVTGRVRRISVEPEGAVILTTTSSEGASIRDRSSIVGRTVGIVVIEIRDVPTEVRLVVRGT